MSDEFARAMLLLQDEVDRATVHANNAGLSPKEIADELRRIADDIEREGF